MITGEGKLMAHGSPGYFYLPPNLTPGSQSLELKGKGPHKVYWLAQDHPDAEVEGEFIGEPIGIPEEARDTVIWPQTNWDLLGRPSTNESPVEIRFENGKWIKVIRLP
jgi:hypothetical protein